MGFSVYLSYVCPDKNQCLITHSTSVIRVKPWTYYFKQHLLAETNLVKALNWRFAENAVLYQNDILDLFKISSEVVLELEQQEAQLSFSDLLAAGKASDFINMKDLGLWLYIISS